MAFSSVISIFTSAWLPVVFLVGIMIVLAYFIQKTRKLLNRYKKIMFRYKENMNTLRNTLLQENQTVALHREELLAQAEHLQELNMELERLSLVASKTDTAVIIADKKGRFTWVNQGFVNLYGYTLAEVLSEVGPDIYSASNEMNIKPVVDRAIKAKKSLNYTSMIQTKSGESKWIKTTLNPILDENKQIQQYVILQTDVSELKQINDKLKKLSLVASKTSNSVLIFNAAEQIDWVNEGFHNLYGYTKGEFIALHGDSLKNFLKVSGHENLYKKVLEVKSTYTFVSSIMNRDSELKWKQTSITPIHSDAENIVNFIVVESDITKIKEAEARIEEERDKADRLLLNILPEETAEELKSKGEATPRFYRSVSVLFADIQDFTKLAENLTPKELVEELQSYFSRFDDVVTRNFVEKIKTMGDAFLCVGGIPMRNKSHPFDAVLVGLNLQRIIRELGREREEQGKHAWNLRVGIHSGPIVAGVVGKQKMTYDIWGDTVNIAKRIESACVPGMVNVSSTTYEIIKDYFECEHRGKILAKHKGHIDMYFVHRIKPEFSENQDGITPNMYFKEMFARL
ncbi:MAG: adenylate/guanylate cyclase domain-containing protein [Salinivirgaceae bacterium]